MIKLSIPFTKDNQILSLVKERKINYIEEIYMPLPHNIIESGRPYTEEQMNEYNEIFEEQVALAKELGLKVNLVANKQFIAVEKLRSTGMRIYNKVAELKEKYDIDKVTLSNIYIIQQYGEAIRDLGIKVELSIMINASTPDAVDQIIGTMKCVDSICLGDAMIHNLRGIEYIKRKYPDLEIKIIPNHGCLVNCIGNQQHHNYSSCTYKSDSTDFTDMAYNTELQVANNVSATCRCYITENGRQLNEISFIRPEDLHLYQNVIDMLKISGREHTAEYILDVVEAYKNSSYAGEVELLLDMSVNISKGLLNEMIPVEFGNNRSNCNHQCYKCNYCKIASDFIKSHFTTSVD